MEDANAMAWETQPQPKTRSTTVIEWFGAVTGVLGNLLVALGWPIAGFIVWLVSNAAFIVFASRTRAWGLGSMMMVYSIINLIGIAHWSGWL